MMDKTVLEKELRQITHARDDAKLQQLVQSLSAADVQQYKTELTEAWLEIYEVWYYDHACHKIEMNDRPESFFSYLLHLLSAAEQINTPVIYYEERSWCYQDLAGLKNNQEEKLLYIEKAIHEVVEALKAEPASCKLNCKMVSVLLDKIKFTGQYTHEEFAHTLNYFERALAGFEKTELSSLLYYCNSILEFTFQQNQYWHTVFMNKLNSLTNG